MIESRIYPDLTSMQEDQRENQTFKDMPYTCMFNPLLPSIGISFSGIVVGYMDIEVWVAFFIVVLFTILSYFFLVIPSKDQEKLYK